MTAYFRYTQSLNTSPEVRQEGLDLPNSLAQHESGNMFAEGKIQLHEVPTKMKNLFPSGLYCGKTTIEPRKLFNNTSRVQHSIVSFLFDTKNYVNINTY